MKLEIPMKEIWHEWFIIAGTICNYGVEVVIMKYAQNQQQLIYSIFLSDTTCLYIHKNVITGLLVSVSQNHLLGPQH